MIRKYGAAIMNLSVLKELVVPGHNMSLYRYIKAQEPWPSILERQLELCVGSDEVRRPVGNVEDGEDERKEYARHDVDALRLLHRVRGPRAASRVPEPGTGS